MIILIYNTIIKLIHGLLLINYYVCHQLSNYFFFFQASPEQIVQQHITYRYNAIKQRMGIMQTRLHEINNLIKLKNPSLLIQLQKTNNNTNPNSSMSGSANRR